jgi:GNAT superfamily N-acetyltransferase
MRIEEISPERLPEYACISIAYEVRSILRVERVDNQWGQGAGGLLLKEQPVPQPYTKDYDVQAYDQASGDGPFTWSRDFDLTHWGFLLAHENGEPVGAAAIAYATPGMYMLEGRTDLAVLWDIRVQPAFRGQGVGKALFGRAVDWARRRGCRQMKIETQDVNVPACRFYAAQGCHLGAIHCYAYAGHPQVGDEVMLLWYLDL